MAVPPGRPIVVAVIAVLLIACQSEQERWKEAAASGSVASYQGYLERFPKGKNAVEARARLAKLTDNALVFVECPPSLKSEASFHNISGPVWVYTITFREIAGKRVVIRRKLMRIFTASGKVWGDNFAADIYDTYHGTTTIELSPYGTSKYTSWVNSPDCELCGGKMVLEYSGSDASGEAVMAMTSFVLER